MNFDLQLPVSFYALSVNMSCSGDTEWRIREAEEADSATIFQLIMELGAFEGLLHLHTITEKDVRKDGFHSSPPLFYVLLYEIKSSAGQWQAIAQALYTVGFSLKYV